MVSPTRSPSAAAGAAAGSAAVLPRKRAGSVSRADRRNNSRRLSVSAPRFHWLLKDGSMLTPLILVRAFVLSCFRAFVVFVVFVVFVGLAFCVFRGCISCQITARSEERRVGKECRGRGCWGSGKGDEVGG